MGKQYGFFVDADRCVMCHACEMACKAAGDVEPGINLRKVIEIWDGDFPNVMRTFVSLSCLHCADPACVQACPPGAISKRSEDGVVVVNRDVCTGCRDCYTACPYGVPQFGADGTMQKCDFCVERGIEPACTGPCPAGALFSGTTEELAPIAAGKGGNRLAGPTGPSMFLRNRRSPELSPDDIVVGRDSGEG